MRSRDGRLSDCGSAITKLLNSWAFRRTRVLKWRPAVGQVIDPRTCRTEARAAPAPPFFKREARHLSSQPIDESVRSARSSKVPALASSGDGTSVAMGHLNFCREEPINETKPVLDFGSAALCGLQLFGPRDTDGASLAGNFVNGDFESGDLTGWNTSTALSNSGLLQVPPTQMSHLNLSAGGNDGQYSTVVNELGNNKNSNQLSQTITTNAADVDPIDSKIHVLFCLAPVLENPGHARSAAALLLCRGEQRDAEQAAVYLLQLRRSAGRTLEDFLDGFAVHRLAALAATAR
jgi:hypothetical protein